MVGRTSAKHVLGVMVTNRAVHAVLLDQSDEELRVVRRFTRQRASRFTGAQPGISEMPGQEASDDFSIQFGSGGDNADNMFLGAEFGDLDNLNADVGDEGSTSQTATFAIELGDILAECRDAGYGQPAVAFCLSSSDVTTVEVKAPQDGEEDTSTSLLQRVGRKRLLQLLAGQYDGDFTDECVSFLPMEASEEGGARALAIFPKPNDPVASTLRTLREQKEHGRLSVQVMDTEVALHLGLARTALQLQSDAQLQDADAAGPDDRNTLVVRTGSDDTLVVFMRGTTLRQSESLRSLTAYEAPETICSRVLLLQDEYGIGDIHRVFLLSREQEDDLVESFEMFFPDARVESLRTYVPSLGEGSQEVLDGAFVPAVGAGLRLVVDERYQGVFEDVNLLPRKLLRRKLTLPVTWHVLALYVVLFCTVFFFVARFFSLQGDISRLRNDVEQEQPAYVEMEPQALQARVDSLKQARERYATALNVLEDLLRGSDQWSRALEGTSREVAKVAGLWVENWRPVGSGVELQGNATARDRVVDLAGRLDGRIESLSFSEIREWPVYSFVMHIPLDDNLPEAAQYLRERVADQQQTPSTSEDDVPVSSAALSGEE